MLRRLYDWTLSLAAHPNALWALAVVSFMESSFFPIPPDILMIPLIIARPDRAFVIAAVTTISSVLGGILGYYIGWGLYESIGLPVLQFYGQDQAFENFAATYNEWGVWMVVMAGVTPFPYKVITILSGMTAMPFAAFVLASIAARAMRFFAVAILLYYFGAPIRVFIEKRLGLTFSLFAILLLGGFAVVRYL